MALINSVSERQANASVKGHFIGTSNKIALQRTRLRCLLARLEEFPTPISFSEVP
jgi:hypothetical protein